MYQIKYLTGPDISQDSKLKRLVGKFCPYALFGNMFKKLVHYN